MRKALLTLALALIATAPAQAATRSGWDKSDQKTVARAGVMAPDPDGFHGERALTPGQLQAALDEIDGTKTVHVTAERISVATFHKYVVKRLGLADLAKDVRQEAVDAGLEPPARFGTEVVARAMGLRYDHPSGDDALELYPNTTITRAEAAYSFARVLEKGSGSAYYVRQLFERFKLPTYTDDQKRALHVAVSKIGVPYVWGGESDTKSSLYGAQAHGGYDCSGFVWRVFKLSGDPHGDAIQGRTSTQMAEEFPKKQRVDFEDIEPGDLLFFYPPGISHVGIALSKDFMIHSSSQGVYVTPLFESWIRPDFAWARHVL
jgi:cell wall-associated NlpC family hydrolase